MRVRHLVLTRRLALTAGVSALALIAGCSAKTAAPTVDLDSEIALYGTDGVMATSFGDQIKTPGAISGMAGTAALTPLPASFKERIKKIDPTLEEYNYAGEAYDAVVITALATDLAGSTNGHTIATYINGVTIKEPGGAECDSYISCLTKINQGVDIAYRGYSVHSGFTKAGEPSTAEFGTQHFDDSNQIDDQKTEFVNTGDPSTASQTASPAPDKSKNYGGPALKLGVLLAKTGVLAPNNKPIFAATRLAIKDINDAGGVLDKPIDPVFGDDGTDPGKAVSSAKTLIADGATAIIGPSFSGAALKVIPVAAQAGVVLFSPSATSAAITAAPDDGMFFRTSPSDSLQAQALADVIMRGGARKVFIVARDDSYGQGLEHDVAAALTGYGIPSGNIQTAEYSSADGANNTARYAAIATSIMSFKADSVVLLGYDETAGEVSALLQHGAQFRR
jgi:ABC-type branched-subunit amino acid transport system substrate-binding protein